MAAGQMQWSRREAYGPISGVMVQSIFAGAIYTSLLPKPRQGQNRVYRKYWQAFHVSPISVC